MLAYRLVVKSPKNTFLPILALEHAQRCLLCTWNGDEPSSRRLDQIETESLIGPNPRELYTMSEGELMRLNGGLFWVALARMAPTEPSPDIKEYPERERKQVELSDYLDSTQEIPGSSSPVFQSSSSFEVDTSDIDEDEHESLRNKPEDMTIHLINCFLQHALSFCLLQGTGAEMDVRPRIQRMSTKVVVGGQVTISAEDDGGICQMRRAGPGWKMHNPFLALIEAKKAFRHIYFDEKTESYEPVTSNEHLAQCFGEAVITWKGNRKSIGDKYVGLVNQCQELLLTPDLLGSVFVVAATNTFLRFCHFRFGPAYMQYLDAKDEMSQKQLAENMPEDTCVYVELSDHFNIQSPKGRRAALCHTFALIQWHDNQRNRRNSERDDDDDDNDTGVSSGDDESDVNEMDLE